MSNAVLKKNSENEFAYKFTCKDQGAFFYSSERDIRQAQPDQNIYTNYTTGPKTIQPDQQPKTNVPNQGENILGFF